MEQTTSNETQPVASQLSDGIEIAKSIIQDAVREYDPQGWIKNNPQKAALIGLGVGLAFALRKTRLFHNPVVVAGMGLAFEFVRESVSKKINEQINKYRNELH